MTLTDYMCQEIKGERRLDRIKDSVDDTRLEDYIEKHGERQITTTRNNTDYTKINRMEITRKQKWEEKWLYGCLKWLTSDISREKTWTWQRKGNFKKETESILIKVGDRSRGRPEGSLYDSYNTKVYRRVVLLSMDGSTLPLIYIL